ncbi:glycerol-3-phosphate responsive antiterminator [Bacillus sp. P14.5]|uniref:glycerol-3-phosphate responsive antiterminator n=1 Tax=Bacillus sp. P14.5 TaxID=1983400 RepID=UPI000DE96406|nr:glycerol-3-phosphate responsive antiterminator [Bacillus sp. P14.5]
MQGSTSSLHFEKRLQEFKKIASIKKPKHIEKVFEEEISGVFLLTGNIGVLKRYVDLFKSKDLPVFIHIDKIGGLSSDIEGVNFLANYVQPTGIISTRSSLIKMAKKNGLLTIQRLFLVDTEAVNHGLESIEKYRPDYVEIMPAIVPEVITYISENVKVPVMTGGLVKTPLHMTNSIKAGAAAVSTSNPDLWKVDLKE